MSTWVLAGVVLTGAWTQLDEIGIAGWLPVAAMLALDRAGAPGLRAWRARRPPPALLPLIGAAALSALILGHVALTFREEFGFGGDEGYHLSATRAFALYYLRAAPILAAVVVLFAVWRWKKWPYAASIAMAGLVIGSYFLPASALFGRYPAGFYHLATPLNVAFEVAGIPYPFTANHVVNALSVPAWLFVLRPLILGRWPDWRVMPAALLLYFQGPALVYTGSALLEPWAFVFLLLAFEALAALEPEERWIAVPLAATATFFKETTVLLLPTVSLIACVEWRGFRPVVRRGAFVLGAASVMPFLFYLSVRSGAQIERTFDLGGSVSPWTAARVSEWLGNVRLQLGMPAAIALVLVIAAVIREWLWIATAAAVAVFFFAEAGSIPYNGYGRFLAYALLAVCGAVLAVSYRWPERRVAAMAAIIAALQLAPVAQMLALDFEPDYARNSLEWHRSLIRLPIRSLADRIGEARDAALVRRVRVVTFGTDLTSLQVAYPDLADRYGLAGDQQAATAIDCRCRDNAEAVIAGFEWPAHFDDTPDSRSAFAHVSAACVEQINTTCGSTILERHRSGDVIGALGVGKAVLIALPQHDQRPQR